MWVLKEVHYMPSIAIISLRIWKQANMLLKSDWLVLLTNLRRIMQIYVILKLTGYISSKQTTSKTFQLQKLLEIVWDLKNYLEISGKEFIFCKIIFPQFPALPQKKPHRRSSSIVLLLLKEQKISKLQITDWLQI